MIKNDKQLKNTREVLEGFQASLEKVKADDTMPPLRREYELGHLTQKLEEFRKEISEYESLKKGMVVSLRVDDFSKFPEIMIKARLAKGWTQAELAERVGIKEQQIQRYEASDYSTASLPRIDDILYALGIKASVFAPLAKHNIFMLPPDVTPELAQDANARLAEEKNLFIMAETA